MLDDSSLIAIQGPSWLNNELAVYKYQLQGHGSNASISDGKKLGKLCMKFRMKEDAIPYSLSAFRDEHQEDERTLHIVVCNPDGDVEVVAVKVDV